MANERVTKFDFTDEMNSVRSSSWRLMNDMQDQLYAAERELRLLRAAVGKYKTAMDALYNHNEAVRHAVVEHFGVTHPVIEP